MGITAAAPLPGPFAPATALLGQAVAWFGPAAIAALPSYGGIRDKQILNDPANEESAKAKAIADARSNPQAAAAALLADFGWSQSQMSCLIPLWNGESRWRYTAENRSSGAYGIPQALPGSKMSSAGADWRTNPVTQIRWGLGYIKSVYGSPCNALSRWNSRYPHWY